MGKDSTLAVRMHFGCWLGSLCNRAPVSAATSDGLVSAAEGGLQAHPPQSDAGNEQAPGPCPTPGSASPCGSRQVQVVSDRRGHSRFSP